MKKFLINICLSLFLFLLSISISEIAEAQSCNSATSCNMVGPITVEKDLTVKGSLVLSSSYLGIVSTRGMLPTANLGPGSASYQISQSMMWLDDTFQGSTAAVLAANFYVTTSNIETTIGSGTSITAAIATTSFTGPYTACNGGSTALPNGVVSIGCSNITIAKNSQAWVCLIYVNPNGIVYEQSAIDGFDLTEGWQWGTGTPPTISNCGSVLDSSGSHFQGYRPIALISNTNLPSGYINGDSRSYGLYDSVTNSRGDVGNIARWLGPKFAYVNGSISGTTVAAYLSNSHSFRDTIIGFSSFIINQLGVNDITGGATAAAVLTNRSAFAALYPTKITYGTTIEPVSTSSDNWQTTTNQTAANVTKFSQFNAAIRAGISGEKAIFDVAQAADPYGTNIWPVTANYSATVLPCTGSFTGANVNGLLTITAVGSGALTVGCPLTGSGVNPGTYITSFISGSGNTGTYGVFPEHSWGSTTLTPGQGTTIDGIHQTSLENILIGNVIGPRAALVISR